eukprot:Hpha_TRINITY_DN28403_c0_g1::TRINITY_DN28403_c0_g1_i1::g.183946::m.183946
MVNKCLTFNARLAAVVSAILWTGLLVRPFLKGGFIRGAVSSAAKETERPAVGTQSPSNSEQWRVGLVEGPPGVDMRVPGNVTVLPPTDWHANLTGCAAEAKRYPRASCLTEGWLREFAGQPGV